MIKKRKMGFIIVIVPFLIGAIGFTASAIAGEINASMMIKKEQDGSVSKEEFMKHNQRMFEQHDKNQNGYLDTDEMRKMHEMMKKMHDRYDSKPSGH